MIWALSSTQSVHNELIVVSTCLVWLAQAMDAHYEYTPRRFVNGDAESAEGTNAVRGLGWAGGIGGLCSWGD